MLLLVLRRRIRVVVREIAEEPQGHRTYQDDAAHLLQILLSLFPGMTQDGLRGRNAVRRQLHHERQVVILEEKAHDLRRNNRQHYAEGIKPEHDQTRMMWEEGARDEHIHRHAARAGHQRNDQHRYQTALRALYRPCRHDRRHIASEAHDHRDEGLAVKPYLMHQTVHDEGRAGHISRILEQRNEEIQQQDVRQEDKHAADSADDAVHRQILQPSVRHYHGNEGTELGHYPLYPLHRILPYHESTAEYQIQKHKEQRKGQPPVGHEGIYPVRQRVPSAFSLIRLICFRYRALDEGVFCVHEGRLHGIVEYALDPSMLLEAGGDDLVSVGQAFHHLLYLPVALEILYRKISGRIFIADGGIELDELLYAADRLFQFGSVIDMDMSCDVRIAVLINLHDRIEKSGQSVARTAYRRHDRHTEKITQLLDIQLITLCLKLVIHIQGHHHTKVHIDQLGGKVEIALKVGCIHDIDDYVRHLLDEILTDIKLFRTIGGEGVRARQIDQQELIASVLECTFLRIDGNSAVIAHMLMTSRGHIEERGLSAVRVTHERDPYDLSALGGKGRHLPFEVGLISLESRQRLYRREQLLRFILAYDLDLRRLLTTKRNLVTDYLIFNGIPERGVQDHLDLVALHKPHFYYSLSEASVAIHLDDHRALPRLQFGKSHIFAKISKIMAQSRIYYGLCTIFS